MKRKTNISVQDNLGTRVSSNMIVGDKYNGYTSGDILDANAIVDVVKTADEAVAAAIVLLNKKISIMQNLIDKIINRLEQLENA